MTHPADASHVVIIGAGHAGTAAAAFLRQFGLKSPITLVGDEGCLPYQRPPLSKGWLKGEVAEADLLLRPGAFYLEQGISLSLGARAVRVDRVRKVVVLQDGNELPYSHLIVATGARPRTLVDLQDLGGVYQLRTREDADRMRHEFGAGRTLTVIGGGYVGLEVAATARLAGMNVVVVERESRLLARVASPELSEFVQKYFASKGIEIHLGCSLKSFESSEQRISGVLLSNGRDIATNFVLVGIGSDPNDSIMNDAGVTCTAGVLVDEQARTSDPSIFAIGDCTNRPLPFSASFGRLESVANAVEQARQAASAICGRRPPKIEVPWFWSDQFDLRLQMAGLRQDVVSTVVRSECGANSFAVFHLNGSNAVRAVETVNASPEFMAAKMLIASGRSVCPTKLGNGAVALQDVAA